MTVGSVKFIFGPIRQFIPTQLLEEESLLKKVFGVFVLNRNKHFYTKKF